MIKSGEFSYPELLEGKKYTSEDIKNAALIVHRKVLDKYGLKEEDITFIFEEGSNFEPLENPIVDENGNEFWDSEGYYMAQRIDDSEIKKMIAFCSIGYGLSRKTRVRYELEADLFKRIDFMRKAIKAKFDNNPHLRQKLLDTGDRQIIEYTYWEDIFFGIDNKDNIGANVLGKLLMEYRDRIGKIL